ncbi:myeloid differentiation primary response protein MyD88 [Adelges cooleyi]|uniref:myeloid differentiation primary response protein MyD88 n=1 Tax=Adelges cooleyi TaxID=133065 RepID=UPI00217FC21D|nr:myeloid differentiation primary response protein MyD88 [Adelges cooleyi]
MDKTEDDCSELNISILQLPTRERLSCMLNAKKVLPSPENFPRDWRGLCTLLNYTIPSGCDPTDPVGKIFKFCENKVTIAHFVNCLERLDRYDVADEIKDMIKNDISEYKKKKFSLANPGPVIKCQENDADIITLDDLHTSNNNLPFTRYDAFLLFDDADIESATKVVQQLENNYNLRLCLKDRDLRPGVMFEYQSIIRLISDRCNWLITIVSNNFLNSPWNRFIINYTQVLAIEQRVPKIIPCVFGDCMLPPELKCYVHLFFNRHHQFCDPWKKLRITVSPYSTDILAKRTDVVEDCKQKLETIIDSTCSNKIAIEQKDDDKIYKEEIQLPPKNNRNILERIMHSVGNFSNKIAHPKSNKKRKHKKMAEVSTL